jgi:predicted transcriptional regulator of viral defense system
MRNRDEVRSDIGTKLRSSHADWAIRELAERQHGVVARRQLLELDMRPGSIVDRITSGRLHPVHRGIYVVGHRLITPRGRWMAGVLAGGREGALSHRAAGRLWNLVSNAGQVDVTVPRARPNRPGLRWHVGALPADERTVKDGIPVTTVPRTLLDLATVLRPDRLQRALHEAEVQRLYDRLSVPDLLARHPHRRGAAALRRILATTELGRNVTRNDFEQAFLSFLDEYGLPRPEVNEPLWLAGCSIEPDCLWRAQRAIVELDSFGVHGTRKLFESDRARDRALTIAGWRAVRVTWRQLQYQRTALARDFHALLAGTDGTHRRACGRADIPIWESSSPSTTC